MIELSIMSFTVLVVLATCSVFELYLVYNMSTKYKEMKELEKSKDIFKKSPNEPTIVYENGRKRYLYKPHKRNKNNKKGVTK